MYFAKMQRFRVTRIQSCHSKLKNSHSLAPTFSSSQLQFSSRQKFLNTTKNRQKHTKRLFLNWPIFLTPTFTPIGIFHGKIKEFELLTNTYFSSQDHRNFLKFPMFYTSGEMGFHTLSECKKIIKNFQKLNYTGVKCAKNK